MPVQATVWTADFSGTVELARCAGPRTGMAPPPDCWTGCFTGTASGELDLSNPACKAALYECCLSRGTPFDIYRWVNLEDLASLWPRLHLAPGLRAEWEGALRDIGLLEPA
jgi:hypothetical protein